MGNHAHLSVLRVVQLAPRYGGVALQLFRFAQQKRDHLEAGFREQPRRHHAVAAVVAGSTQHRDTLRQRELLARKTGDSRRRIAHQINRRNEVLLRGGAVDGPHLVCGINVHRIHGNAVVGRQWSVRVRVCNVSVSVRRTHTAHSHSSLLFVTSAAEPARKRASRCG